MYSNCLFFALKKFVKNGGYFIIRKSRHGFWFHFMWSDDLKNASVEHFVPFNKLKFPLVSKILFKGRIKKNENI